nr:uroporphyrinogen-III synthase [Lysinibacillus timonensis]
MLNESPLKGKTVVVTGSSVTTTVLQKIEQLGGEAIACPLIKTVEILDPLDHIQLEKAKHFDWMIFTSQNAVEAFCAKMKRHKLTPSQFTVKIAAVGSKTRDILVNYGFCVDFVPTTFSADVFVQEFPKVAKQDSSCLFVRGKKAKNTIKNGLPNFVSEWNVYDTEENDHYIEQLINLIQNREEPILLFASPSAVNVYALHIAPLIGWRKVKIACIGHITAKAIKNYGATVSYQPKTYTMEAVIYEIIK